MTLVEELKQLTDEHWELLGLCMIYDVYRIKYPRLVKLLTKLTEINMLDVWVMLPDDDADEPSWTFVCTMSKEADFGELLAACEVLYPNMIGFQLEPLSKSHA